MRIVFMGTPKFAIPTLRRLIAGEHQIMGVFTQPDKPAGRGHQQAPPPVKLAAGENGLAIFQPKTLRDKAEIERLARLEPDAIVLVAYGQMLPQAALDIPKFGCLNIHPSLLPKYRGASPIASAILAGDEETGVTIMLMNAGMDTGPILSQKKVTIDFRDTTETLESKLAEVGADLLMETLPEWFARRLTPQFQNEEAATYTRPISKGDGEIDWNLSAIELDRKIRAFYPWPGCYTRWQGKSLKILGAIALPLSVSVGDSVEPGQVVMLASEPETPVGVVTSEGILGLLRIQAEGRKAISAAEFLRGQRGIIGQRLG
ncbi:MAG: methionyl-tRNA formyltransferase [Dehalococcoidia bacterium]